jgi:Immunoglobulin domain/PAS fold
MTLFNASRPGGPIRHAARLLAGLALAVLGVTALPAQTPPNDNFTDRVGFYGATNTLNGSNVGATAEDGETSHAGLAPRRSVWWSWVAPENGPVTLDTAGSTFDTVLQVYSGSELTHLISLASNDDAPGGTLTSLVHFNAVAGVSYQIVVDGHGGDAGNLLLNVTLPVPVVPPGVTVPPASQQYPENAGSTAVFSVGVSGSHPLWFQWEKNGAPLVGATNASLTLLNVAAADAGNYTVVVTNLYGSAVSSPAVLVVGSAPANDAFTNRFALMGSSVTNAGDNDYASLEAGEPLHAGVMNAASLWWTWTAPASGLVTVDTSGSTDAGGAALDTVLAVYTGLNLAELTSVAANGDAVPGVPGSSLTHFRAQAGTAYQIAVASVAGTNDLSSRGRILLSLQQAPDNDFIGNALTFPGSAVTVLDNNAGATLDSGEPAHLANPGGASVWWYWTAPSSGTYTVDTAGSAISVILDVFQLPFGGSLTRVGEAVSTGENNSGSGVKFVAAAGARYYISLDGFSSNGAAAMGDLQLNLRPALASNDHFSDRLTLAGGAVTTTGSNVGATKEPGEPVHAANPGGASAWWTWTAPGTGPVTLSTAGSSFDTLLAVYTGSDVSRLTAVAANDDLGTVPTSEVTFTAVAGVNYQIAVDGFQRQTDPPAEGHLTLSLKQFVEVSGGNDSFANRYPVVGVTGTVTGDNTRATKEFGEPDHAGNPGASSLWWSWLAPASGRVTLDTLGTGFLSSLAVYTGTEPGSLTAVAADIASGSLGSSHVTFTAVQGVEYQIAVDSWRDGNYYSTGGVVLNLKQFGAAPLAPNDSFSSAQTLSTLFPFAGAPTLEASRQADEPSHCGTSDGASVWWKWTAASSGRVTINTLGSDFDSVLSVYTGPALDSLTLVAENDDIDPDNLRSQVSFQAVAGTIYRIAVDGYADQRGLAQLNLNVDGSFATAPRIEQNPRSCAVYATGGPDDKATFKVEASGSDPLNYQWFYQGQPLAGATGNLLTITNVSAQDAGSYTVEITNANGSVLSSPAQLNFVSTPYNDHFTNRTLITGLSNSVYGDNSKASLAGEQGIPGFARAGNSLWWRWVAPSDGPVEISTYGSVFQTLIGVYVGGDISHLSEIAFNAQAVPPGRQASVVVSSSRCVFYAIAGQEYEIAVSSRKTNYLNSGSVVLTLEQPPRIPSISSPSLTPDGHQTFAITGTPGALVRLESSTDLVNYRTVLTTYLPDTGFVYTDPDPITLLPERVFRVVNADLPAAPGQYTTTLPVFTNTWDLGHVGVFDLSPDGIYLNANELYLTYLQAGGYSWATNLGSILGATPYYFYAQDDADSLLDRVQQCLDTGATFEELTQVAEYGLPPAWQYINLSPLRDGGGELHAVRVQFYQTPAPDQTVIPAPANEWEATQLFISDKDTNSVIINANGNYIASLQANFPEIRSLTNLIGRDDYYFYPPADADKFRADDHQVMSTGIGYHAVEANQQIGGTVTYLDVTKTPLRDAQGRIFGVHIEFFTLAQLSLQRVADGEAELSWPTEQSVYRLQESASVNGPWTDSQVTPVISGGKFRVAVTPAEGGWFYRLFKNP